MSARWVRDASVPSWSMPASATAAALLWTKRYRVLYMRSEMMASATFLPQMCPRWGLRDPSGGPLTLRPKRQLLLLPKGGFTRSRRDLGSASLASGPSTNASQIKACLARELLARGSTAVAHCCLAVRRLGQGVLIKSEGSRNTNGEQARDVSSERDAVRGPAALMHWVSA